MYEFLAVIQEASPDVNQDQAIALVRMIIPIVLPVAIAWLRSRVAMLDGYGALWVNLALNIGAQLLAGAMVVPGATLASSAQWGAAGALAGSGGYSLSKATKSAVAPAAGMR